MTKKELKELIKEVIVENNDYDKMTPQQKHQYSILRDLDWKYDYTENGKVYMNRWDRGSDGFSKLATMVIEPDGNHYREKSTNEGYVTDSGKKAAKERIVKLKAEYDRINKLKDSSDYLDTNDPQARNFHNKRLKEIPNEISKIRQKILDI